jgi:hypothetical protein
MISEIVRSSANIGYGAKSQWSNFFHGLFLLIFILLLRPVIELIPVSALAGMLIFTGFRLASPKEFKHMWEIGRSEFIVFVATCVIVLATDLLIGIAAGILINLLFVVIKGQKFSNLFRLRGKLEEDTFYLEGAITFSNYMSLKKLVLSKQHASSFKLNFSGVDYVDHNVMHHLEDLKEMWSREGRTLHFDALEELTPSGEFPTAERRRGGQFEVKLSKRDQLLLNYARSNGFDYNPGSVFGYEFRNFKLLANLTVDRAHNIILGPDFQIADVQATERVNLEGGQIDFTAFVMPRPAIPEFRLGNLSFFDSLQELFAPKDIRFDSHPQFSDYYLLTSEFESETRKLFTPKVMDFLEEHRDFKMEVNENFVLIFRDQRILDLSEIAELQQFSTELLTLLTKKAEA